MYDATKYCDNPERLKGRPQECSLEQIEKCHGMEQEHSCVIKLEEKILMEFEEKEDFLPNPLVLMSKRPGVLSNFMAYGKQLFEGGPLNDRERFLIALSAAAALKSPNCIRAHTKRAQKAGATKEEVLQAILIAGMISNTSSLHVAYDSTDILDDSKA